MVKHFEYKTQEFGGTEYMARGFEKHILPFMPKLDDYLCLILPGIIPRPEYLVKSEKEILLWMHNAPQQFSPGNEQNLSRNVFLETFASEGFLKKLKYFIVVSEELKRLTLLSVKVDPEKVYVIHNAITPIIPKSKPDKIKLISTSTAARGMHVLLESLQYIDEDITLEIYNDFYPDVIPNFVSDPRVKFFGKTPKETVRDAISTAHIHAYPCMYVETFCLSQVEAMSAGLLCVTSDLGALPEVSNGHTIMYKHTYNEKEHAKRFAEHLQKAIDMIKNKTWDPTAQIEYVNSTYSWEAIKNKWLDFQKLL